MKFSLKEVATIGIFSAMAYAGAYLVAFIHNIEFLTGTIFLAGLLFGKKQGALVGCLASALYAVFNPWGVSPLPLFVAQVASRGVVGYAGGILGTLEFSRQESWRRTFYFAVTGLLLTGLYLVAAQFSYMLSSGFTFEQLKIFFTIGIPSSILLLLGNTLQFALALPFLFDSLRKTLQSRVTGEQNVSQELHRPGHEASH